MALIFVCWQLQRRDTAFPAGWLYIDLLCLEPPCPRIRTPEQGVSKQLGLQIAGGMGLCLNMLNNFLLLSIIQLTYLLEKEAWPAHMQIQMASLSKTYNISIGHIGIYDRQKHSIDQTLGYLTQIPMLSQSPYVSLQSHGHRSILKTLYPEMLLTHCQPQRTAQWTATAFPRAASIAAEGPEQFPAVTYFWK